MPRDFAPVTPQMLLSAYASGIFPMAEGRDDPEIYWVDPKERGILPLDGFVLSRSLARIIRRGIFRVTLNEDFAGTVAGCADRDETWINGEIADLYARLHAAGVAHSIEVRQGDALVGGVYGVALGGAFFGESMFSRRRDASKVALAHAVAMLRRDGFTLFDTQFPTDHLASLGGLAIPRADYRARLRDALGRHARLTGPVSQPAEVMHLRSQTS